MVSKHFSNLNIILCFGSDPIISNFVDNSSKNLSLEFNIDLTDELIATLSKLISSI